MPPSLYLLNPSEDTPGYYSTEVLEAWGIARVASIADLAIPTVAALAPRDWKIALCDQRVQQVNFDTDAEIIGITGKVSQRENMKALATEFRRRGKLVVMGGPYASLNPDDLRPHADIVVHGELEEIAPRLFADIASGKYERDYEGTRPDLASSPLPRWDLYPRGLALNAQVQTSRGCPFECEFCDVIQYLGRKQRWKEPDQVVRELDQLYRLGYRNVLFADDNFTVMRRRARALVERLAEWNAARRAGRAYFTTQLSIDIARDPDLLAHCVAAGLCGAFIGIETPNEESLADMRKRQNLRVDLAEEVRKIVAAGMMVVCGIVVGFDQDGPDIFERQAAFVETLPVPCVSVGLLVAPPSTPLYARVKAEGRLGDLNPGGGFGFFETNMRPKRMSAAELQAGMKWLVNRIYSPAAFARRLQSFVALSGAKALEADVPLFGPSERLLARRLAQYGPAERRLIALFEDLAWKRPELRQELGYALVYYCQFRHVMEFRGLWNPSLAARDTVAVA
jgi:radical SAM superfamily enzyme YgiQ (UPF0313 family)